MKCHGHRNLLIYLRVNLPAELDAAFYTLLVGNSEISTEYPHRLPRLVATILLGPFGQYII